MSDFKEKYKDQNITIVSKENFLQDSPDEARTVVMKVGDREFGFEFVFGELIHTWQRWKK